MTWNHDGSRTAGLCLAVLTVLAVGYACSSEDPGGKSDMGGADAGDTRECVGADCPCVPDCSGKMCGPDGCGGQCGTCETNRPCVHGMCVETSDCVVGAACDDGDLCTKDDKCGSDKCSGKPYGCDDGLQCTTDRCVGDGTCEHVPKPFSCLVSGECFVDGEAAFGNPCRACLSVVDQGEWSALDGGACDDGDLCTLDDTCQGGECVPGSATACDDGNGCTSDKCGADGLCEFSPKIGECDDGDPCTYLEECKGGECLGVSEPCNDGNECTADWCQAGLGCVHELSVEQCEDGNPCTVGDSCVDGACISGLEYQDCDDGNMCTADICIPVSGCEHSPVDGKCDDGDPCTLGDWCSAGACLAGDSPLECDDGNECTSEQCEPGTGCVPIAVEGQCDDGNQCATGDYCKDGACKAGEIVPDCDDQNSCTADTCVPSSGCKHTFKVAACDDGNACTSKDECKLGSCVGAVLDCDDNNPCTYDLCKADAGCVHSPAALPCDDGDPCTLGDSCAGGKCLPGATVMPCDDGNPCTTDFCQPLKGCAHSNVPETCDDGNPCTQGDYCSAGQCIGGSNGCKCLQFADCVPYDDADKCNGTLTCDKTSPDPDVWRCVVDPESLYPCDQGKDTVCLRTLCVSPSGQCVKTAVNSGMACDDADACTAGDVCQEGNCVLEHAVVCDDGSDCTTDFCQPPYGCMFKPVVDSTPCGPADTWRCLGGHCVPCTPDCYLKECGDNGCGSTCGECLGLSACWLGQCVSWSDFACGVEGKDVFPYCGTIAPTGCCVGDSAVARCSGEILSCGQCSGDKPLCGWDAVSETYQCTEEGGADPSGMFPKECEGCVPPCLPGWVCAAGQCLVCQPNCAGKDCGPDGCGGDCGACAPGDICQSGKCLPAGGMEACLGPDKPSYPYCAGISHTGCCDSDGRLLYCTGGSLFCVDCGQLAPKCGWNDELLFYDCFTDGSAGPSPHPLACSACIPACWPGTVCDAGKCVACNPACQGKECGDDGCSGSCGECPAGHVCNAGKCIATFTCGKITWEGECSGDTLYWCQDSTLMVFDCAQLGQQCGYVAAYKRFACKSDCGGIQDEGKCSGSTLIVCGLQGLEALDCASYGMTCGFDIELGGYSCLDGCGNVTFDGVCQGDMLLYCGSSFGGGNVIQVDCAAYGMTCGPVQGSQGFDCVDSCAGITPFGLCEGNVLKWCDASVFPPKLVVQDCSLLGMECQLVSPSAGFGCMLGSGTHLVSGAITYEHWEPGTEGLTGPETIPAGSVEVSIWDTLGTDGLLDDVSLAAGFSNDDGSYVLSFVPGDNTVYVAAHAFWSKGTYYHSVESPVGGDPGTRALVGVISEPFAPLKQNVTDLHIPKSSAAGAFHILQVARKGFDYAQVQIGTPPPVWFLWDGYDQLMGCAYSSYYSPKETYIHISVCGEDTDDYDDSVILHEYGHHVSFSLSLDDNPGGPHGFFSANDPNLAWSEGFATWFGQTCLADPIYVDATPWIAFTINIEKANDGCKAKMYLPVNQKICESIVSAVLWDIYDVEPEPADILNLGPEEIFSVVFDYLPLAKTDRGDPGVDLVDFLDGWLCSDFDHLIALKQLVGWEQFPYDFAPTCPPGPGGPGGAPKPLSPLHISGLTVNASGASPVARLVLSSTLTLPGVRVRMRLLDGDRPGRSVADLSANVYAGEPIALETVLADWRTGDTLIVTAESSPEPWVRYAASASFPPAANTLSSHRLGKSPHGIPAILFKQGPPTNAERRTPNRDE